MIHRSDSFDTGMIQENAGLDKRLFVYLPGNSQARGVGGQNTE
jgi:hypothetical protein